MNLEGLFLKEHQHTQPGARTEDNISYSSKVGISSFRKARAENFFLKKILNYQYFILMDIPSSFDYVPFD